MATTANGIVYPVAGDFVAPLNTHFQDLAESVQFALDNKEGRIVQVASAETYSTVLTSSTSLVDTGLSLSFTPVYANSRILIFGRQALSNDTAGGYANLVLVQNSTTVGVIEYAWGFNSFAYFRTVFPLSANLAAGSTATRTYKTQFSKVGGSGNITAQHDGTHGLLIAIEVKQ